MADSTTLDIRQITGRLVLEGAGHVGRLSFFMLDMIRGLSEVRIWWPRMMIEPEHRRRQSVHRAAHLSLRRRGHRPADRLSVHRQHPYYVVGTLVVSSIILELGPVLTALILAGRIGARYAAELGTMRVTEQIDALESLGRSPASHLVIPRVLAGLIMIPALTTWPTCRGVVSGWIS